MTRRTSLLVVPSLVGLSLGLATLPGRAEWLPDGVPICSAPGNQTHPVVTPDGSGGVYVAWTDARSGPAGDARVRTSRLTAEGTLAEGWPENGREVCSAPGDQRGPVIALADMGGIFVAWQDRRDGQGGRVFVTRLAPDGQLEPGWPPEALPISGPSPLDTHDYPTAISTDGAGGAFILWQEADPILSWETRHMTRIQRLTSSGSFSPGWPDTGLFVARQSWNALMTPDGSGGVNVVLSDYQETSHGQPWTSLWGLSVSPTGAIAWPELLETDQTASTFHLARSQLVSSPPGGALVGFRDRNSFAFESGVGVASLRSWSSTAVLSWRTILEYGPGIRDGAAPAAGANGDAIVAWVEWRTSGTGVVLDGLTAAGTVPAGWPPEGIRIQAGDASQRSPALARVEPSRMIVAWEDDRGAPGAWDIYALGISLDGEVTPPGSPSGQPICTQPGNQYGIVLEPGPDGSAIAVWWDERAMATHGIDLYGQRIQFEPPVAVAASLASSSAEPGIARLTWSIVDGAGLEATVYRASDGGSWAPLARVAVDGSGVVRYKDTGVLPGIRYGYRLGIVAQGVEQFFGEAWVTIPRLDLALEGMTPNPSAELARIRFTLPDDAPATLELLDLSGRRIARHDVGALGAGQHVMDAAAGAALAPGVYVIRLTRGEATLTARGAIVR